MADEDDTASHDFLKNKFAPVALHVVFCTAVLTTIFCLHKNETPAQILAAIRARHTAKNATIHAFPSTVLPEQATAKIIETYLDICKEKQELDDVFLLELQSDSLKQTIGKFSNVPPEVTTDVITRYIADYNRLHKPSFTEREERPKGHPAANRYK